MKLSRRQLRKMILQEMKHMGRVQDLTKAYAMTSQEDNRETYVAQIAADLKDYCESEAWNCAVDYDPGMDRAEVIIGTGDDNMANNISLEIDENGVTFEDGMTLQLMGGLDAMMNAVVSAIYDRMM